MGGTAGITMLLGMVRTKFAAVLIGTMGAGLLANFGAIQGMLGTLAGLGLATSAVREVATAVATGDQTAIGRTVLTLRRMCWFTGILGMVALMALSPMLAQWTFGNQDHTLEIAALGLIILFGNLSAGHTALFNGMRRIGDLARLSVISAVVVTVVNIAFYLWLGLRGIVPALVLGSAINLAINSQYARRIHVLSVSMSWAESFSAASDMIKLGFAMMWNNLLLSIAAYITVKLVTTGVDVQAAGIYGAAFALSGMFINFVLNAMSADYFPRLTGHSHDKVAMCRLVNEQTEIGLLLAVPGLLATLSLAPWIIKLFYTTEFLPAVHLLQWFTLGCLGRIVAWPLGWLTAAMQKGWWLFTIESISIVTHLILIALFLKIFGLEGVAIAFFVLYAGYAVASYFIGKHLIDFSWSNDCKRLILILTTAIFSDFVIVRSLPDIAGTLTSSMLTIIVSLYCFYTLLQRLGDTHRLTHLVKITPVIKLLLKK